MARMVSTGAKSSVRILPVGRLSTRRPATMRAQVVAQIVARLHRGGARHQVRLPHRRPVIADRDHVAAAVIEIDRREHAVERRGRGIEQHGRGFDVLHHHPARREPRLHQRVELLGEEMERHERPAIGVDQDDVPAVVVAHQERAAVGHHRAHAPGLLEAEVFLREIDHVLVDLDREDRAVRQRCVEIGDGAAAAEPDLQDALGLGRCKPRPTVISWV